jgi:hypothetical protein
MSHGADVEDPADRPAELGFASVDAAAGSSWMSITGVVVGLVPVVVLASIVLFALAGPVGTGIGLAIGGGCLVFIWRR